MIEATPDVMIEPPDEPEPPPAIVHHVLPEYLAKHPDPQVRRYWQRVYRQTARLKAQLHAEGALS